jgi:hypothetical protein
LELLEMVDEIVLTIGSTVPRFEFFFISATGFISMFFFFRGGVGDMSRRIRRMA